MKIFKSINKSGKCVICNTNDDGEVCLIGKLGTEKDGNMEAIQVHIKCLDLFYIEDKAIIIQKIR